MALDMRNLVESYVDWLKSNIYPSQVEEYWKIITPFLDRHNDHLQIYVKEINGSYLLTDDGYILNDLAMSGCEINTRRRREILEQILNGFGVRLEDDALVAKATKASFPQKKHLLLQAMLSVNDMFMMSPQRVLSVFFEDVAAFLEEHNIRYVPAIQLTGRSGFTHTFDFVIPSSKNKPERLINALNVTSKDKVQSTLLAWNDVSGLRRAGSLMYVFLNDIESNIRDEVISAFEEYRVTPIRWSERNQHLSDLTA